jgi:phosphate transport system substrate-binding protein
MKCPAIRTVVSATFILILCSFVIISCGQRRTDKSIDTPTSGKIKVGIDDSYKLMMEAQFDLFTHFYKDASFDTIYDAETNIINMFLKDSIETMVISKQLSKKQMEDLRANLIVPTSTLIAHDAIAFILNKDNKTNHFLYDQIRDIFLGKIKSWNQIGSKSGGLGSLKMIFDKNGSANVRYFKDKFQIKEFPSTFSAAESNEQVISFVEKNKNAIGIISVNWISDPQDSISHNFLQRTQVAGITAFEGSTSSDTYYKPYQAYIVDQSYPFTREVYFINRQTYNGLGLGLASFIAGEKGQTVILRSGMVPAAAPVRVIELKK